MQHSLSLLQKEFDVPISPRSSRAIAAVVASAACLAAVGCGGGSGSGDPLSGMSAKQVTTKAIASLKSAPSFTITGSVPYSGHPLSIDLGFKGKDCAGTIGEGSVGSIAMVVIGTAVWLKPDATFWKSQGGSAGAEAAKLLAGKYLKSSTSDSNASPLASICDTKSLTAQMDIPADVAKGPFTTVDGQRVLALTDKAKNSTMYVTDTAVPRIMKVTGKQPGDSGQFTIAYGVPATVTAPPASQTVDGAQYGF